VVIVSGSVRESLFAQPLVAALEGAWVFAPAEGLGVLRLRTVGRGFAVSSDTGLARAWQRLRSLSAGMVVVPPPVSATSAMLAYFSGIARRVTIARRGEWWATDRLPVALTLHPVDQVRQLAAFILDHQAPVPEPQLEPGSSTLERVNGRLESAGVRSHDLILLAIPGRGNWIRHRPQPLWPAERFAVLANQLRPDLVVLVRGAGDGPTVRDMLAGLPGRTAVVDLPSVAPDELAVLARRSLAVIGHDGDALHVAAAGGGRTIALLGPSDLAPYGEKGAVLRVDALEAVPARQVLEVARQHLGAPAHA